MAKPTSQMANLLGQIPWRRIPWRRLTLIAAGALVSYLLIPIVISRYNDIRSLREARLARAVKFGDRDSEFAGKVNAVATMLRMFGDHTYRMKISGTELKEAQRDLYENYRKRYLEIDATEWWWPSEFQRESGALNLLSPDEVKQLDSYIQDYNKSVQAAIFQIIYMWKFLDSPTYRLNREENKNALMRSEDNMLKEFQAQYAIRYELVKKIAVLFADSNFRTGWWDLLGLPRHSRLDHV